MPAGTATDVTALIGRTPMVQLNRIGGTDRARIYAKVESLNPGGSIKDRVAYSMIKDAEERGLLRQGGTIVEPTSGNTGIGLAVVAAARGYRLILTMPDTMSIERRHLLQVYGVELVLTPGELGMPGAIDKAVELVERNPGYYMPQQFENPANPEIHRRTTALEIMEQLKGQAIDAFVAGVGTGGTITGVGEALKQRFPHVMVVAVEPETCAVLSGGKPGPHKIQGIGAGFIPKVLNTSVLDRVIPVRDSDAFTATRELARLEGLFVGISSGAAAWAAIKVARELGPSANVVVILPDTGERYLSMIPYFRAELDSRL